jgi:AcrR family transcriptional regulator
MQERLLRAAVESLYENGYARTTTQAVQAAAGVSRGALLHHYRNKQELLVAAVAHLAAERAATLRESVRDRPASAADGGLSAWLDDLWGSFDSPLFSAVLELWIAARTDAQLRDALLPYERYVKASILLHSEATLSAEVLAAEDFAQALDMTLLYLRGLALTGIVTRSPGSQAQSLAAWKVYLVQRLVTRAGEG